MFENITKGYVFRIVAVLLLFVGLVVLYTQFRKTDVKSDRVLHRASMRSKFADPNRGQAISSYKSQKAKSKFGQTKYQDLDSGKKTGRLGSKQVAGDTEKYIDGINSKKSKSDFKSGFNPDEEREKTNLNNKTASNKTKSKTSEAGDSYKPKKNTFTDMKKDQIKLGDKSQEQNRKKDMDKQRQNKDSKWFQGREKKPSLKEYQDEVLTKRQDGQKYKDEQHKDPDHKPSLKEYQEQLGRKKMKSSGQNDINNQKREQIDEPTRSKDKAAERRGDKEVEGKEGRTNVELQTRNKYGQNNSNTENKGDEYKSKLMDKLRKSKQKSSVLEKIKEATLDKIDTLNKSVSNLYGRNTTNKSAATGVKNRFPRRNSTSQLGKDDQQQKYEGQQSQSKQTLREGEGQKDKVQREDTQRQRKPDQSDRKQGQGENNQGKYGENKTKFSQTGAQQKSSNAMRNTNRTLSNKGNYDSQNIRNNESSSNRESLRRGPDSTATRTEGGTSARRNPDGGRENRFRSDNKDSNKFNRKDNARKYPQDVIRDPARKSSKEKLGNSNTMRSEINPGQQIDRLDRMRQNVPQLQGQVNRMQAKESRQENNV